MRIVFAAVLLGSLWLLFAGHNQPGGGFVGGIVAGAAVSLRYVSGGLADVRRLSRGRPWMVLGAGLLISVSTAIVPLLLRAQRARRRVGGARPARPRRGQDVVGADLRHRRVPRRHRAGDDGLRVVRRRPAADRARRAGPSRRRPRRERADGVHRRRAVRHRHVPRAAAQAVAADHRPRSDRPRRQHRVRHRHPTRHAAADRVRRPRVVRRSAAAVARADGHRHQLRRHRPAARARLPQLAADPRRRGPGRRRGPQASAATPRSDRSERVSSERRQAPVDRRA